MAGLDQAGSAATLPPMLPVRLQFPGNCLPDVERAMRSALDHLRLQDRTRPGQRVALTAGSRGIKNLPLILRTAVRHLKALGVTPVVVAAMGSHGGGTAEGQLSVLAGLGITPETVECEVRGGTEVTELGRTAQGRTVLFDAFSAACDGILVINRVKPHPSFHGPLESGLVKMLVVGLGKPSGAAEFHSHDPRRLSAALAEMGGIILARMPILGGVAVLENAQEETADLVPLEAGAFIECEPELLQRARAMQPRLPVRELDLLVVDEMGKQISGTGMDTNVIGRVGIHGVPDGEPSIQRIVVLDLSAASHGNANGMGLADLITRRFQEKIDFAATYLNTMTATFVGRARMPIALESDRAVIEAAVKTLGNPPPHQVRAIWIHNTLELEQIRVSPAVWDEIQHLPWVQAIGPAEPMGFDGAGTLLR